MRKLRRLLCRIFGHRWTPFRETPRRGWISRSCGRCGEVEAKAGETAEGRREFWRDFDEKQRKIAAAITDIQRNFRNLCPQCSGLGFIASYGCTPFPGAKAHIIKTKCFMCGGTGKESAREESL